MSAVVDNILAVLSAVRSEYTPIDQDASVEQAVQDAEIASRVVEALKYIFDGSDDNAARLEDEYMSKISQELTHLGDALFRHVSPSRIGHTAVDEFRSILTTRKGLGTVHLELGTWIAWPESRAAAYVAEREIGDMIRLDLNPEFAPDVAASVTALPFRDESIDTISSNSLFEHVAYPHDILMEAFRVLRPGGVILTSVPFHFVQHDCPKDYLRFTGHFFEDVCADIGFAGIQTDTKASSGVYYVAHQLLKAGIAAKTADGRFPDAPRRAHLYAMGLLGALQALDPEMVAAGASHFHTTHAIAYKPGRFEASGRSIDRSLPFVERHPELFQCPKTWAPLHLEEGSLVDADGQISYPLVNGVPTLVTFDGRLSTRTLMRLRQQAQV